MLGDFPGAVQDAVVQSGQKQQTMMLRVLEDEETDPPTARDANALYVIPHDSSLELWDAGEDYYRPRDAVFLTYERTKQRRGSRLRLSCPNCDRRTTRLFDVKLGEVLWGCRQCLGLTYPSQNQHRMLERDFQLASGFGRATYATRVKAA